MWRIFVLLWLMYLFSMTNASPNCIIPAPLSFPISNVTVASLTNKIVRRGFGVGIGSPSQSISLMLKADTNNTLIYRLHGDCGSDTTAQCTFTRGGAFDSASSSTFSSLTAANGTEAFDEDKFTLVAFGEDVVALNSTTSIPSLTLYTWAPGQSPESAIDESSLGLGRNSTFLDHLYKSKQIASRTWSLFWGLEGATKAEQMNGSLTFGGYDAAKTTGQNMTQSFSTLADMSICPSSMIVTIVNIQVRFRNGTTVSLFGQEQSAAIRSCIKPDVPLISFPSQVFTNFVDAIGGTSIGASESYKLWGIDYSVSGIFDGDLIYTFDSGLDITVPNEQLVVPDVIISDDGQMTIPNSSVREILVYDFEDSNANDMSLHGQAFLSSAYLHVDNDNAQFVMWQANPTTEQSLVTVNHHACSSRDEGSGNFSSSTTSTSASTIVSNGEKVGIAFISVAFVVLIAVMGYLYMRQRKNRACSRHCDGEKHEFAKAELCGSTAKVNEFLPHEIDSFDSKPRHEADGEPVRCSSKTYRGDDATEPVYYEMPANYCRSELPAHQI